MKQKVILVLSLLIGALAFLLTNRYLAGQRSLLEKARQDLYAGMEMIEVVAAARDLPQNTTLTMSDIGRKSISSKGLGDKAVTAADYRIVLGKKIKYALKKEETIMWSDVDMPNAPGSGLAYTVKPGMRAVSISVSGAASVSGLVQPNDRVDVLGTFLFPSPTGKNEAETVTLTLIQDVTVLAVGQTLARQQGAGDALRRTGGGYNTVSFEVTPREAELLVFAENMKGRLSLTLRHPDDISYESSLPNVDFSYLEKNLRDLNLNRQQHIRHKQDL